MMKKRIISLCLVSALVLCGCATTSHRTDEKTQGKNAPQAPQERNAEQLLKAGLVALHKKNYSEAIDLFSRLRDWYPFSKHAVTAELRISDAHYGKLEYEEAISGYEKFVTLHPRNPEIPYALYQTGKCYMDQMRGIDRDQTDAIKANDTFQRLLKQYPGSSYTEPAKAAAKQCQKSILRHEMYVAKFYLKAKNYRAALNRFKGLLNMYPDVGVQYEALGYITRCQVALAKTPSRHDENPLHEARYSVPSPASPSQMAVQPD
jgi:outer membrane protein assembly factor BamD